MRLSDVELSNVSRPGALHYASSTLSGRVVGSFREAVIGQPASSGRCCMERSVSMRFLKSATCRESKVER